MIAGLEALFEDGGRAMLHEGGLGETWSDALAHVPAAVVDPERAEDGGTDPVGVRALVRLREFWSQQHDLQPALASTKALIRWYAVNRGPEHPDTVVELSTFGGLAMRAGRVVEGGQIVEKAWKQLDGKLAENDLRLAIVAANAARQFVETGRLEESARALGLAHRIRTRQAPGSTGIVAAQLGEVLVMLGRVEQAAPLLVEAVQRYRAIYGSDHPSTIARIRQLAAAEQRRGRFAQAVPLWREAWAHLVASGDDEGRAAVGFELGVALEQVGQRAEALRMLEETVRLTREIGERTGEIDPELPTRLAAYANAEAARGGLGEAEGLLHEALEAERRISGSSSAEVAGRYAVLGAFVARTGRIDEAIGWLDTAASLLRSNLGDTHPRTHGTVETLVNLLMQRAALSLASRDREYAGVALARAMELAGPVLGHVHEKTRKVRDLREKNRLG